MKKKGAASEVSQGRDQELMRLYHKAMSIAYADRDKRYTVRDIYVIVSMLPCNRYYISEDNAWRYVNERVRGKKTISIKGKRRRLYETLYAKVMQLKLQSDNAMCTTRTLVYRAMQQEAPCIGLSPERIRSEIERIKRALKNNEQQ